MSSRNKICSCGSGKLYRKCCGKKHITATNQSASSMVTLPDGQKFPLEQVLHGAMSLHQEGRIRRAAQLYKCILEVRPKHADAMHLLGVTERQLNHLPQAAELIRSAIAINPGVAIYHSNLGQAYCAQGLAEQAENSCRRSIELDPTIPESFLNLGHALRIQHRTSESVAAFEQAMNLRPGYHDALLGKGDALHESRQYMEALACYQQLLEITPDSIAGLTRVGINLRVQGRTEAAITHYQNAIERFPKIPELHFNLAVLYHKIDQIDDAVRCLHRVLEITPDDTAAQHLIATFEGKTTESAPAEYVRDLFDTYAETFETHLVEKLGYKTPELLAEIVKKYWGTGNKSRTVLDLGCGTGLFGVAIADSCSRLIGVDLAEKMINKAREKGIYTELMATDVLSYLESCESNSLELVAAADVFVYIGNLSEIFVEVFRVLRPGGLFAFTVEAAPDDRADFILDVNTRYCHSTTYLRKLANTTGMVEQHFESTIIRYQHNQPVQGYLCMFMVQ